MDRLLHFKTNVRTGRRRRVRDVVLELKAMMDRLKSDFKSREFPGEFVEKKNDTKVQKTYAGLLALRGENYRCKSFLRMNVYR